MNTINPSTDQLVSIVKTIAIMLCGYAVNRGYMSNDTVELVSGFLVATVLMVVGIYQHSTANTLKAAAKLNPDIQILVPEKTMRENPAIAAVVKDTTTPQVKEG